MKDNMCMFNDDIVCKNTSDGFSSYNQNKMPYCRECGHLPDLSKITVWKCTRHESRDLEYALLIAIGSSRQKNEKNVKFSKCEWWTKDDPENGPDRRIPGEDHTHFVEYPSGGVCVHTEPYNMHMDDMKKLISFCETYGYTFRIDGESSHFPGRCFRIIITKKRK
jgi:hypothetical protein